MHFEIYRSGNLVNRSMTFESLTVNETLNAVDTADMTFPSPWCILAGDNFWLYDGGVVLKFVVMRVEPTLSEDNTLMSKATMEALVGEIMACTAITTESVVAGATLGDLANVIEALALFETGEIIVIDDGAAEAALTAEGIQTQANDAVGALRDIVTAAGLRWRTRMDLGNVVQYGAFGETVSLTVKEARGATDYDAMMAQNVYPFRNISGYTDNTDIANVLIPEGGKWSEAGGQQVPLTLQTAAAIAGYTITAQVILAQTVYTIEITGNTGRCWKKIVVPNIVPEGDPPSPAQIAAAADALAQVAARYLTEYAVTLRHFQCSVPVSLLGKFVMGNKITLLTEDLNCGGEYKGLIFVASRTTTWGSDNSVETSLELSTRLESLSDPLSAEFGRAALARRIVDTGTSFEVCGLANPNIVIPFGQTFATPPSIVPLPNGTATLTIVAVSTTNVTVNAVPIFPNVLPLTVCVRVYPP